MSRSRGRNGDEDERIKGRLPTDVKPTPKFQRVNQEIKTDIENNVEAANAKTSDALRNKIELQDELKTSTERLKSMPTPEQAGLATSDQTAQPEGAQDGQPEDSTDTSAAVPDESPTEETADSTTGNPTTADPASDTKTTTNEAEPITEPDVTKEAEPIANPDATKEAATNDNNDPATETTAQSSAAGETLGEKRMKHMKQQSSPTGSDAPSNPTPNDTEPKNEVVQPKETAAKKDAVQPPADGEALGAKRIQGIRQAPPYPSDFPKTGIQYAPPPKETTTNKETTTKKDTEEPADAPRVRGA